MSTKWNGKYAKEFVTLFELYGANHTVFEKKFRKKYEKVFGKPYTLKYHTTKVAYHRHATINRFLNYKRKNLCDLPDDFKYFGAWLMNREHKKKIKTNLGYWGILDSNNEVLSEWESDNTYEDDDLIDDSDDDSDLMVMDSYNNSDKKRQTKYSYNNKNKKRKLNSKRGVYDIGNYKEYIELTESFDDYYGADEYNNNNNDIKNKKNKNKTIKGVNDIHDAMNELQSISPKIKNKGVKNKNNKKNKQNNVTLMQETLVKLQEITKQNKKQITIDNLKDVFKIAMDLLTPPDLDMINLLIGIGFNKINLFFMWLNHQNVSKTTTHNIPAHMMIKNVLMLMKLKKIDEFINLWLLIRSTTNDDIDKVLFYLNDYFKDIKGCIPFSITNTCVECNAEIGECINCQQQHNHCVFHIPETEMCIPPDINENINNISDEIGNDNIINDGKEEINEDEEKKMELDK